MDRSVLFVVIAAVAAVVIARFRQGRRHALERIAREKGWTFDRGDVAGVGALPLSLLHATSRRRVENTIQAEVRGHAVTLFDLANPGEASIGTSGRPGRSLTCGLVRVPARFPHLVMEPDPPVPLPPTGLDRVELEWGAFNETFDVWASTRLVAHAVVDARLMAWLHDHASDSRFELLGDLVVTSTSRIAPRDVPRLAEMLIDFVERIPSVAFARYGAGEVRT